MAVMRTFARVTSTGREHPTESDATWTVVTAKDGTNLLQVSTYGSDARVSEPKVSQTFQIDKSIAFELVAAIFATFGPLESSN